MISKDNIEQRERIYLSPSRIRKALENAIQLTKQNVSCYCKNPGVDFTRERLIPFDTLVYTILNLGSKAVKSELADLFLDNTVVPTDSAFTQQRTKLYASGFRRIFNLFIKQFSNYKTYKGYYLLACDGSDVNIPYNPDDNETHYKQKNGKGYNQLHLNALYDVLNHVYVDAYIDTYAKTRECGALEDMIKSAKYHLNSIIIADRGYEKYSLFATCIENNQKFIVRVKDINSNGILSRNNLPDEEFDKIITKRITRLQTNEVKENLDLYVRLMTSNGPFEYLDITEDYYEMKLRVVRFKITDDTYECIVTNIDQEEISAEEMKEIYHLRWVEETAFRNLKWTIGMVYFHSKNQEFCRQEIYASLIMYNLAQIIINNTYIPDKKRKYEYKINFKTAVTVIRQYYTGRIGEEILIERIKKYLIPIRPDRKYVRNMKPQSAKTSSYYVA